jgi:hypothetical protein
VAAGELDGYGALSIEERLYVALAANAPELVLQDGYTIVEAIARLGPEWTDALVTRWRCRGNPEPAGWPDAPAIKPSPR